MNFYIQLQKATNIKRDEDGIPYSWKACETIVDFTDPLAFAEYVDDNISSLANVVPFTGSANLLMQANAYIANKLKEAKVLV